MDVVIIMGSRNDSEEVKPAQEILQRLGVANEMKVLSAHRTPSELIGYVTHCENVGVQIYIAAAGGAAHLAGSIAARTIRPVIGIPIKSKFMDGLDSLLSTVQMPSGIPVATVAVGGAKNAGLLAAEILALRDKNLDTRLRQFRANMRDEIIRDEISSPKK